MMQNIEFTNNCSLVLNKLIGKILLAYWHCQLLNGVPGPPSESIVLGKTSDVIASSGTLRKAQDRSKERGYAVWHWILVFLLVFVAGEGHAKALRSTLANGHTVDEGVEVKAIGPKLKLGGGSFWDEKTNTLYYVDLIEPAIHRYVPATEEHSSCKVAESGTVSFVLPVQGKEGSEFAVGLNRDIVHLTWDGHNSEPSSTKVLCNAEEDIGGNMLNDGKADRAGRIWTGTLKSPAKAGDDAPRISHVYSFENGSDKKIQLSEVGIANGLTWSTDYKTFYFIDSCKLKIVAYDFHEESRQIDNERTVFDFKAKDIGGLPDGMTTDSEGKLWIAIYMGGKVIRIDPESGELLYTLPMPCYEVTSVVFGGPNLDDLYVTSGSLVADYDKEKFPQPGQTFKVSNLGFRGTPSLPVKLS